jgi:flavin-dependent dehydrogenase
MRVERAIDVAIIGGGIAGVAAALSLAHRGQSIVLIAPPVPAGLRVGESLSPAGNALLRELGLGERFAAGPHRPANITFAAWGSPLLVQRPAMVHAEGPGHVLDRPAFERMLVVAVQETDVALVPGTLRHSVPQEDGWFLGLQDGRRLAARFVLDCSGRAAVFARRRGCLRRADRLVAAYTCLAPLDHQVEPTPATLIEAVPDGWWYATLLPDRRLSLAFFSDPDQLPRGLTRDVGVWRSMVLETAFVRRWLDTAGYAADALPQLASAGTTWLEPAAGPNWAAAGDAAVAFDPLSSHGLTSALWAGRRVALGALAALDDDPVPLAHYAATIANAVGDFLVQRQVVYSHEGRFHGHPFWDRRLADRRRGTMEAEPWPRESPYRGQRDKGTIV